MGFVVLIWYYCLAMLPEGPGVFTGHVASVFAAGDDIPFSMRENGWRGDSCCCNIVCWVHVDMYLASGRKRVILDKYSVFIFFIIL